MTGDKHPQWKGDLVSYGQLHRWARRQLCFPRRCWLCDSPGRIEVACINGVYTKSGATWAALCPRCHRIIDGHPYMRDYAAIDPRRRQVQALRAQGLSANQIAARLGVSARTILRDLRTHVP